MIPSELQPIKINNSDCLHAFKALIHGRLFINFHYEYIDDVKTERLNTVNLYQCTDCRQLFEFVSMLDDSACEQLYNHIMNRKQFNIQQSTAILNVNKVGNINENS